MDRLSFLRSLLGTTTLLTVPPLELIPPEDQDRLAWTKDCQRLHLYDGFVRGFRYYDGPQVIHRLREHDELDLVREHANEHDPNAVSVHWQGHKLGYLPMGENVALANLIDHGLLLSAYVLHPDPELDPWEQCYVGVELLVPVNPSFKAYITHYLSRPDAGYKLHQQYVGEAPPRGDRPDLT